MFVEKEPAADARGGDGRGRTAQMRTFRALEKEGRVAQWGNVLGEEHVLEVGGRQVGRVAVRAPDGPRNIVHRHILRSQHNTSYNAVLYSTTVHEQQMPRKKFSF